MTLSVSRQRNLRVRVQPVSTPVGALAIETVGSVAGCSCALAIPVAMFLKMYDLAAYLVIGLLISLCAIGIGMIVERLDRIEVNLRNQSYSSGDSRMPYP